MRPAGEQEVASMMGAVVVMLGSLMIGVIMDAAVSSRMAMLVVRRFERATVRDLAARSAAEYAAMLLQRDTNRAIDHPGEEWAVAALPRGKGWEGVWPDGASVRVVDLERCPDAALFSGGRSTAHGDFDSAARPRWMNVMTAGVEAWVTAGFTPEMARVLRGRVEEGMGDVRDLYSVQALTGRDLQRLRMLVDQGMVGMRSEIFRVVYCEPGVDRRYRTTHLISPAPMAAAGSCICREMILRREPTFGGIRLLDSRQRTCEVH